MDQEKLDAIDNGIAELRLKLIQVVGSNAQALGFTKDEIQDLMEVVQPEFFKLWFAGIPDDQALIQAIQKGDLIVSREFVEKAVAAGESPAVAFDRIRQMKLAAGGEDAEAVAMAERASAAFADAISSGASAGAAVEAAFATAA